MKKIKWGIISTANIGLAKVISNSASGNCDSCFLAIQFQLREELRTKFFGKIV